jgi:hypothetical protein
MEDSIKGSEMPAAEVDMLADRMASSYVARLKHYLRGAKTGLPEAEAAAGCSLDRALVIIEKHPRDISWHDLDRVRSGGPEGASLELWRKIKQHALDEVSAGLNVSAAVREQDPYSRALVLALRQRFRDEWKPQGGIEDSLVDILAQTFFKWQYWLEQEIKWGGLKDDYQWSDEQEPHSGPRLAYAEAAQYAAEMADRSHRQFMRTLRAMRDLRRYSATITIRNEGQINIGGQQQVNNAK